MLFIEPHCNCWERYSSLSWIKQDHMWRPGPAEMESFCNPWMSPAVVYRDNKGHGQDPSSLAMCRFFWRASVAVVHLESFSLCHLSLSPPLLQIRWSALNIVQQRSCKTQLWPSRLPSCPSHTTSSLSPHLPRSHLPFVFQCKQCFMGCVLRLDSVEKAVLFLVVLRRAEHALIIKGFNRTAQSSSHSTMYRIFSVSWYTGVLLMYSHLWPETYSTKYVNANILHSQRCHKGRCSGHSCNLSVLSGRLLS